MFFYKETEPEGLYKRNYNQNHFKNPCYTIIAIINARISTFITA